MTDKFESYEDRFPVESEHLSGAQPFLQIERLKPGRDDRFRLHCAASIFSEAVCRHESQFPIADIALRVGDNDTSIDLNEISAPERVTQFYLYCPNPAQRRDKYFEVIDSATLTGLETLKLNELPGLSDLTSSFPNLKSARLRPADQPGRPLWNTLENLELFGFSGSLSDLGVFPHLRRLLIEDANLSDLNALGHICPFLEVLLIRGHRKPLDVSCLTALEHLTCIDLDIGKQSTGWNDLRLPRLKMARLKFLDDPSFVDNHPNLDWFKVKTYTPGRPPRTREDVWRKKYGEFGFGGFHVPEELR